MPRVLPMGTCKPDHPLQYEILEAMERLESMLAQYENMPKPTWVSFDHEGWIEYVPHFRFQVELMLNMLETSILPHQRTKWEQARKRKLANQAKANT